MAEEPDVQELAVQAEDSSPEVGQSSVDDVKQGAAEPVDEKGVPLKNRQIEADRRARMSASQAERALTRGITEEKPAVDQEEAIKIVEGIADKKARALMEPLIAKQFLLEHPDAVNFVEDINQVRALYPELASADKLEIAYKIVRADRQAEVDQQRADAERRELDTISTNARQAAAQGTGKVSPPSPDVSQLILEAQTLEDLQALELQLT